MITVIRDLPERGSITYSCDTVEECNYAILNVNKGLNHPSYGYVTIKLFNKYIIEADIGSPGFDSMTINIDCTATTLLLTMDKLDNYVPVIQSAISALEIANKELKPEILGFREANSSYGKTYYEYYPRQK